MSSTAEGARAGANGNYVSGRHTPIGGSGYSTPPHGSDRAPGTSASLWEPGSRKAWSGNAFCRTRLF